MRNRNLKECDRAATLVQLVAVKVEQNSENYHSFIKILEEDKIAFREILKHLNDKYISFAGGDH